MAPLDWLQRPAVESVADRRGGAWVFRETRMPVATIFETLELGASLEQVIEQSTYSVILAAVSTVDPHAQTNRRAITVRAADLPRS